MGGFLFFRYLQTDKSDLLDFRGGGNKWEIVNGCFEIGWKISIQKSMLKGPVCNSVYTGSYPDLLLRYPHLTQSTQFLMANPISRLSPLMLNFVKS